MLIDYRTHSDVGDCLLSSVRYIQLELKRDTPTGDTYDKERSSHPVLGN